MFTKKNYGVKFRSNPPPPKEVIDKIAAKGSIVIVKGSPLVIE